MNAQAAETLGIIIARKIAEHIVEHGQATYDTDNGPALEVAARLLRAGGLDVELTQAHHALRDYTLRAKVAPA